VGTKRTMNSKSDISKNMRSVINSLRTNIEIDKMIKEATRILASRA
jgi:hypothetical protein